MGFKVIDNLVIVDHSINHYAITTPTKKRSPCIYTKKNIDSLNLSIYSIFYRSVIDRKLHKLGDNCPLLYALKGKQNLVVTKDSMKELKVPFYQILEILKEEVTDWISNKNIKESADELSMVSDYPTFEKITRKRFSLNNSYFKNRTNGYTQLTAKKP